MQNEDEKYERIRQRAYAIWESEGRPEGQDKRHWEQARHEIETGEPFEETADEGGPGTIVAPSTAPHRKAPGAADEP
ncbi:MAG TPA: DUF2934 domain-containing protein [Ensifer sp.]|jgi:hypothetical protein|uniref:DUF2934 domain-containing protein n=1 Tax=Ensifer sp. TaxID=1872086 RepID=UPI002E139BAA|nr:DUF2934 domain-containing protein [Ensifer sp.]